MSDAGHVQARVGRDHRALPGRGDGAVVLGVGRRPGARRRIPPVGLRAGRADQRRAGGLRRWAASRARIFGLPDRVDPRRLFAGCRAASARRRTRCCWSSIRRRAARRCCASSPASRMAGVYPVGMKLASTWAKGDMGLMVGILVGALTLGSASPHLFNALGGVDWRIPLAVASASALARRAADRLRRHRPEPRADAARSIRARRSPRGATCRCGSPTWAISATCGSSTRCGRGSACSSTASFALTLPPDAAPVAAKLAAFATIAAGGDRLGRRGPARRPARPHDDHDRRDGGDRAPARRRSASCSAAIPAWLVARLRGLGHQHRRRLRAVLGVDRRAGRPRARRHDADACRRRSASR